MTDVFVLYKDDATRTLTEGGSWNILTIECVSLSLDGVNRKWAATLSKMLRNSVRSCERQKDNDYLQDRINNEKSVLRLIQQEKLNDARLLFNDLCGVQHSHFYYVAKSELQP